MDFLIELIAGTEQQIFINASIKRTCSAIFQTQMSDTSSEVNYSPLPLSPAPSEVPEEDPYEVCSDEEHNDEEDASMRLPEMGATWEPVVHAFAGTSHEEVCDRMDEWADENSYDLSRRGNKKRPSIFLLRQSRPPKTAQS